MMKNDKYVISNHRVSIYEVDSYNIVHHSCYYEWIDISQRIFLREQMYGILEERGLDIHDCITKKYKCKHILSSFEEMDIIIKTILISCEESEEDIVFKFKHLIFKGESNQKIANSETEVFFKL